MNKKFTKLIAALALLVFMTPSLVGWGQVSTATATNGNSYVVAYYADNKYYALPHGTSSSVWDATEVSLNSINKVDTETAADLSWTLTEGSTTGQFYITYGTGSSMKYLIKSGTTGNNKNLNVTGTSSTDNLWEFSLNTGNNNYTVKSLKSIASGTTGAGLIYLGYGSVGKYGVYASDLAASIILLEIGDVPPTPTYSVTLSGNSINADYQGNVTSSNITVSTNLTGNEIVYEIYYNNNGTYSSINPYNDWFIAEVNANNEIECTIVDNLTGTERPAQFKVYALDNEFNEAYSEVITLTQAAQPQVATPTFSPVAGPVVSGTEVTLSCTTAGATIYYTVNDGALTEYTAPITINENTTIEAYASADGYRDSETATASYTIASVLTVTEVLEASTLPTGTVLVSGIVSRFEDENILGDGDNHRYYISADGTTESGEIRVYKGKGLNNQAFTNVDDVLEGDQVIICGELNVYSNMVQLKANNYLVSLTRPDYYTLTVSSLSNAEMFVFAGNSSEMLFEGTGSGSVYEGAHVMLSVEALEGYELSELLVNGDNHTNDIEGGMYQFIMPNTNVTVSATATRLPYYTVSFTTNGLADGSIEVVQGQAIAAQPTATADYIPSGYEFTGWYAGDYENATTAPTYVSFPYIPTGNVTLKAVFAEVEGSSSTGALTQSEITTNITNTTCSYGTEKSYVDSEDNITWVASCNTDAAGRPWMQLKKDASNAYIKIVAPNAISSVEVVITAASNQSGGITDINKHNPFAGTVYLTTSAGTSSTGNVGSVASTEVTDNTATITASGSHSTLYIQVTDGAARIWGITVTSGSVSYSNYRTSYTYTEGHALTVGGYANDNVKDGYCLIASPVTVNPANVAGMTTGDFDLYYFNQSEANEWRNYEATAFNLVPGTGYLYAKKATTEGETFNFTLTGKPYAGDGNITLDYDADAEFAGFNLIGNPFGTNATLDMPYYRLKSDGSALKATTESSVVQVMEGVFVQATPTIQTATFEVSSGNKKISQLSVNVMRNRSAVLDNAIIRFDDGATLGKFQLFENSTKVYIPVDGEDYAVVRGEEVGAMPVNFKAEENGTYSLSLNSENVEFAYLHLVDNMTGIDVDLLQTPSYSFEAKTTDYESRFKLVFATGDNSNSDTFAFYSNGSFVINNEGNATLQVVDVTGRIVKSESINGCANVNVNAAPGVYMLRLVNGDNVKVQKVVVR